MKKLRASTRKPVVLAPLWPNAGVENQYNKALRRLINTLSTMLIKETAKAWKLAPKLIAPNVAHFSGAYDASQPSHTLALQRMLAKWGSQAIKSFDLAAQSIATNFASRNMQATQAGMMAQLKKGGFTVAFKPTQGSIEAYRLTVADNVGLIKNIPQKWYAQIEQRVWNAVRSGSDLHTLSTELRKTYKMTLTRAALIARDQNAKAKALIERVRRQELGITQAIWMHSGAGREPRRTHIGPTMNGKVYDISQGMWDSDEGKYVWPGELVSCRCSDRPVIEGFEDDEEETVQPTDVELKAALSNARKSEGKARALEMRGELEQLLDRRTQWKTKEQKALRREIFEYLRG